MMIMKKIFYLLLLIIFPLSVNAIDLPKLNSSKVVLYDINDDELIYELNGDDITNIASLTKIMTAITAIENIKNLDDYVTITNDMLYEVPSDASVAGLKVNDKVTLRDLLYGLMLPSGADAAVALGYAVSGSTTEFVNLMNQKALELGLQNTHYSNSTGYDIDNHYSTAKDILSILIYALDNELFSEIYKTNTYTLSNGLKVESTLNKYNRLTHYNLSNIIGSKTGFTYDAGLCMASLIEIENKDFILITLNADYKMSNSYHLEDAESVINYIKDNYIYKTIYKKDDVILSIPVKNSNIDSYDIKVKDDLEKYVYKDMDMSNFKFEYDGLKYLSYKNKQGEKIGTIKYFYKDKLLKEDDVYLDDKISISYIKYIKSNLVYFGLGLVLLLLIIIFIIFKIVKRKNKLKHNF